MRRCTHTTSLAVLLSVLIIFPDLMHADLARANPPPAHADEAPLLQTYYLEVFINGYSTNLVAEFHVSPNGFSATAQELREIGLAVDEQHAGTDGLVALDAIDGLSLDFDSQNQILKLSVPDRALIPTVMNASRKRKGDTELAQSGLGAVVNYSLLANFSDEDLFKFPAHSGLAGTFDTRVFSNYGLFRTGVIAKSYSDRDSAPDLIRLDTTWSLEDPETLMAYRAGDFISSGLSWTRPVRLAGFQASRNFGLRNDLITKPISTISGSAAVPSTVDVYVNSARAYSNEVKSGPFEIVNLPVTSGPGTVRIVLRDALGRETVSTGSYYISPMLLASGLLEFSFEAGFPRRSYSLASNDYSSDAFAIGSIRYGLSDRLTLEGHGEIGASLINLGAGLSFGLGSFGAASFSLAGSRYDPKTCFGDRQDCAAMEGLQIGGSIETAISDWRFQARTLRRLAEFADVASVTSTTTFDELGYYPYLYAPVTAVDQLSISAPLGSDRSHVNLSLTHTIDAVDKRRMILGLSHSRRAFWNSTFTISGYHDIETSNNSGIFAGLYFALGDNIYATSGISGKDDDLAFSASLSRSETQEPGSYGWRVQTNEGGSSSYRSAAASYRAETARLEAGVHERSGNVQLYAQADGALAILDGDVFVANRIDDSFAVVDAEAPNVEVFHENRPVGVTDEDGKLLVSSLRSWQPNVISINPANLPVNADISETKRTITPAGTSGVIVKFDASEATDTALVSFRRADGDYIPVGSEVSLENGGDPVLVGYEGQAYMRGLTASNAAAIIQPDGERCTASFPFEAQSESQVLIEDVQCL